jgi:hypothetical protein
VDGFGLKYNLSYTKSTIGATIWRPTLGRRKDDKINNESPIGTTYLNTFIKRLSRWDFESSSYYDLMLPSVGRQMVNPTDFLNPQRLDDECFKIVKQLVSQFWFFVSCKKPTSCWLFQLFTNLVDNYEDTCF